MTAHSFPSSLTLPPLTLTTNQIAVDAAEFDSFLAAAQAAHGDDWRVRLARAADWLGDAYSSAVSRAPGELAASVAASSGAALSLAQVSVAYWERSIPICCPGDGFFGGSVEREEPREKASDESSTRESSSFEREINQTKGRKNRQRRNADEFVPFLSTSTTKTNRPPTAPRTT